MCQPSDTFLTEKASSLILMPVSAQESGALLELSLGLCTLVIHECVCSPYPHLASQILVIRKTSVLE